MSQTFNFIRLPLHLDTLWRLAAERGWLSGRRQVMDEGLVLHHALGEVFGPGAMQPFRLMASPRQRKGFIYTYSITPLETLKANAALCGPEYESVFDLGTLAAKAMPTDFPGGRRLGFDIRLRPVRRSRAHADNGSAREMDAFLYEAETRFPDDPPSPARNRDGGMADNERTREAVYRDWLGEKLDGAATLVADPAARLVHFRRSMAVRNNKATEGPDAVLQGELNVGNSEKFARLLRHGIGRHKAYGYGMILLRPARID